MHSAVLQLFLVLSVESTELVVGEAEYLRRLALVVARLFERGPQEPDLHIADDAALDISKRKGLTNSRRWCSM
jgi:hypothetical protein